MKAPRFVVVTGTDTGVGKTVVTAGLAKAFVRTGLRTVAIKPVESGCGDGPRDAEDGVVLAAATGQQHPREALIRLREPLTPSLAADREGVTLDADGLVAAVRGIGARYDVALVEGAGGLLSPITWDTDIVYFARSLDAAVVVVGSDRLGTLNHVHMTIQVLFDGWVLPSALILSAPAVPDASTGTNAAALRRRLASFDAISNRIVELPRVDTPEQASSHLDAVVGWITNASA